MTTLSWFDSLMYRLVLIPAVKRGLLEHAQNFAWMSSRPAWGKGRIDPQNPFKFTTLEQPIDQTIGNSDMPPLWNMKARREMALHWDGMNTVYREVLLSSGLGNGATTKSLDVDAIDRLGAWFDEVQPPKYPFPIDAAFPSKAARSSRTPAGRAMRLAARGTGQVIPIDEVGHRPASSRYVDVGVGRGIQRVHEGATVGVHTLPQDERHGDQPARRHLAARTLPPQRVRAVAGRSARAGCTPPARVSIVDTTSSIR